MSEEQLTMVSIQRIIGRITLDYQLQLDSMFRQVQELQGRIAQLESADDAKPKAVKKAN